MQSRSLHWRRPLTRLRALLRARAAPQVEEYDVNTDELLGARRRKACGSRTALACAHTAPSRRPRSPQAARQDAAGAAAGLGGARPAGGSCPLRARAAAPQRRSPRRRSLSDPPPRVRAAPVAPQFLVGEPPRLFNPHTTTLAPSLSNVRARSAFRRHCSAAPDPRPRRTPRSRSCPAATPRASLCGACATCPTPPTCSRWPWSPRRATSSCAPQTGNSSSG
jgi:hypothetical protein